MNRSTPRIGYARISTAAQSLDAQVAALEAAGCTMVRTETRSGATLDGRPELTVFIHKLFDAKRLTRVDSGRGQNRREHQKAWGFGSERSGFAVGFGYVGARII